MRYWQPRGGWRALALLGLLTITGCGGAPTTSSPSPSSQPAPSTAPAGGQAALTAGTWQLARMGAAEQPTQPVAPAPTIAFKADGTVGGSSSCNQYGGQYELSGTALRLNNVASTEMACADAAVMEQETRYLKALTSATELVVDGGTLTLRYPEGELVFDAVPAAPAASLTGTKWRFSGFAHQDGSVSMSAGAEAITFQITGDTAAGNGGCNQYSGPVTLSGSGLTLGPIVSTKMACDRLDAEQQFLTALQRATEWEITEQQLSIKHPDGALLFTAD